jgi:sugar lactone lactonase YvrE
MLILSRWFDRFEISSTCTLGLRWDENRLARCALCFATMLGGPDRRTLFMLTADWRGTEAVEDVIEARTGQVLSVEAPAPGVGWP